LVVSIGSFCLKCKLIRQGTNDQKYLGSTNWNIFLETAPLYQVGQETVILLCYHRFCLNNEYLRLNRKHIIFWQINVTGSAKTSLITQDKNFSCKTLWMHYQLHFHRGKWSALTAVASHISSLGLNGVLANQERLYNYVAVQFYGICR